MSSYFSSWTFPTLPSLPSLSSFTLPSGIQRRFISFLLRRTLGKFVVSGQLDEEKIDSQIGSGFVRLTDLDLDHESINNMAAGLPIQLQSGSVASVTAKIPWPNPLTSTLGLSIDSLQLTFHLVTPSEGEIPTSHVDLTKSVVSAAGEFIHDELDPQEEEILQKSLHPSLYESLGSDDYIPGGLDVKPSRTDETREAGDVEMDDVSVFSALVEHLIARFQFDAANTRITLVKPGVASFTATIPEIRYGLASLDAAGVSSPSSSSSSTSTQHLPQARTVTISGLRLTTLSLRRTAPSLPSSPIQLRPFSANPHSILRASNNEEASGLISSHIVDAPKLHADRESSTAHLNDLGGVDSTTSHPLGAPSISFATRQTARSRTPSPRFTVRSPSPSSETISSPEPINDNEDDIPDMMQSLVSLPPKSPPQSLTPSSPSLGVTPSPQLSSASSYGSTYELAQSMVSLPSRSISPTSPILANSAVKSGTMGESVLSLPPRPHSPASSMGGSLYESAMFHSAISGGNPGSEESLYKDGPSTQARSFGEAAEAESEEAEIIPEDMERTTRLEDKRTIMEELNLNPATIGATSLVSEPPTPQDDSSSYRTELKSNAPTDDVDQRPPLHLQSLQETSSTLTSSTVRDELPLQQSVSGLPDEPERKARECEIDETILTIKSEPTTISLTYSSSGPSGGSSTSSRRPQITISLGMVACTLRASHVETLLEIASSLPQRAKDAKATTSVPKATSMGPVANLRVRGFTLLLLPRVPRLDATWTRELDVFHDHPLLPPRLRRGYVRLFIDGISASYGVTLAPPTAGATSKARPPPPKRVTQVSLTINDLSIFSHHTRSTGRPSYEGELDALPILITDPYLPSQYSAMHSQPDWLEGLPHTVTLPSFSIADWTDRGERFEAAKPSRWRVRPPAHQRRTSGLGVAGIGLSTSPSSASKAGILANIQRGLQPTPAVSIIADSVPSYGETDENARNISIRMASLHVFADLGMLLEGGPTREGSQVLDFLSDCFPASLASSNQEVLDEEEDKDTEYDLASRRSVHSTPRVRTTQLPGTEASPRSAKRRLEENIFQDLDLHYDYRDPVPSHITTRRITGKKQSRTTPNSAPPFSAHVEFPMVRIEIRCPPPPHLATRSGAVILDFRELVLLSGTPAAPDRKHARFTDTMVPEIIDATSDVLLSVQWSRILVAYALASDRQATGIISIGQAAIADSGTPIAERRSGSLDESPFVDSKPPVVFPRIKVSRIRAQTKSMKTVVSAHLPGLLAIMTKPLLDGLQFWADDATQLIERGSSITASSSSTSAKASRDNSMIGSRFFAGSEASGSRSASGSEYDTVHAQVSAPNETVIKTLISEVFVRLLVPRVSSQVTTSLPFDVGLMNLDALLELKPEGKEETVLTLGVADLRIDNTPNDNKRTSLIHLTIPSEFMPRPLPMIKLRFRSYTVPGTIAKESSVRISLAGFTYNLRPDLSWVSDLGAFFKAPPGAFESVVPSERTKVVIKVSDGSISIMGSTQQASAVLYLEELKLATDLVGDATEVLVSLQMDKGTVLLNDDVRPLEEYVSYAINSADGLSLWKSRGFAVFVQISDLDLALRQVKGVAINDIRLNVEKTVIRIHMCADTATAIGILANDFHSPEQPSAPPPSSKNRSKPTPTTTISEERMDRGLMASLDEHAFERRVPRVGPSADMIDDDLPRNLDYLDDSFGAAGGLRELDDDDIDEFTPHDVRQNSAEGSGVVSALGGETIRLLTHQPLKIIENYFNTLPPDAGENDTALGETTVRVRVHNCDLEVLLYDGYDWPSTRKTIQEETRAMRRRLAKIRQMLADGQEYTPGADDTSALLYNSVHVGLEQDLEGMDSQEIIEVLDKELVDDDDDETSTQSSWQSLRHQPTSGAPPLKPTPSKNQPLGRAIEPSIEFRLLGADAEFDQYQPDEAFASRVLATVRDLEILDHLKTSTWAKFLTSMHSDIRGNVRETNSNMVRVELINVRPVPGNPAVEARLRAKILPLKLHVDQDALDFIKQFFAFKLPSTEPASEEEPSKDETYFQHAEIFPIDIKLDYKPKRVDYRALRAGRTIELMNFFHFDGSEMTLRHITLHGLTGWARLGDTLNDLWTPDVKATQLVDVISGIAPIRSVVNVGSGVADLVLLPVAQYKKDGRVVRGMQKGATAFMRSTGMEALKLGARLATGTQVILEQAESVLGAQFSGNITAEALQPDAFVEGAGGGDDGELFSRYAEQPMDVREGVQSAYTSLRRNINSAAQTILAVPMEVYERSGNEGPVRAVVRAVPIAVLKPMIGATEAVSKTLLGLHNTFDPNVREETEAKYKQRG